MTLGFWLGCPFQHYKAWFSQEKMHLDCFMLDKVLKQCLTRKKKIIHFSIFKCSEKKREISFKNALCITPADLLPNLFKIYL